MRSELYVLDKIIFPSLLFSEFSHPCTQMEVERTKHKDYAHIFAFSLFSLSASTLVCLKFYTDLELYELN